MNREISALRSLNIVPPEDNEFANWLELEPTAGELLALQEEPNRAKGKP